MSCSAICCPCITFYKDVVPPNIGVDIMSSHTLGEVKITGDSMPMIEVELPPQMTMIGQPGAYSFYQEGCTMQSLWNDGSFVEGQEPGCCKKCGQACARSCGGESMSVAHFTNSTDKARTIGFGIDYPASVVPIKLSEVPDNLIFAANSSFLFGTKGTRIDLVRANCRQCCLGAGLCFQKIDGDGTVFLEAGGSIIRQELKGETHRIDPSSLVAWTTGLDVDVQRAGGVCTMCCGGEGFAFTHISGTGAYWLASAPWTEQINNALQYLPEKKR